MFKWWKTNRVCKKTHIVDAEFDTIPGFGLDKTSQKKKNCAKTFYAGADCRNMVTFVVYFTFTMFLLTHKNVSF